MERVPSFTLEKSALWGIDSSQLRPSSVQPQPNAVLFRRHQTDSNVCTERPRSRKAGRILKGSSWRTDIIWAQDSDLTGVIEAVWSWWTEKSTQRWTHPNMVSRSLWKSLWRQYGEKGEAWTTGAGTTEHLWAKENEYRFRGCARHKVNSRRQWSKLKTPRWSRTFLDSKNTSYDLQTVSRIYHRTVLQVWKLAMEFAVWIIVSYHKAELTETQSGVQSLENRPFLLLPVQTLPSSSYSQAPLGGTRHGWYKIGSNST